MLAWATKDQMRLYKVAVQDRDEGRGATVQLDIDVDPEKGVSASLCASDGKKVIKRGIQAEHNDEPLHIGIPRNAIQAAEKIMSAHDRAYFHNDKIRIAVVEEDPHTQMETLQTKADIPFIVQTEMDFDVRTILEHAVEGNDVPERRVCVSLKDLQAALNQFKHGKHGIWLHLSLRGNNEILKISAFEKLPGEEIFAAVAPIPED